MADKVHKCIAELEVKNKRLRAERDAYRAALERIGRNHPATTDSPMMIAKQALLRRKELPV